MQRVPVGSAGSASSRAGSVGGDDNEAGGSKRKTLEQREADYALARERIYGNEGANATLSEADGDNRGRTRQRGAESDDDDFVPRQTYGHVQPVYASLYHPKAELPEQSYENPDPSFAYQSQQYAYQQAPGYAAPMSSGYNQAVYPPRQGSYVDGSVPSFVPLPVYAPGWVQGEGQIPLSHPVQPTWQYAMPPGPNQPMPMIPQGVQPYPQQYYAQQHAHRPYDGLVQPTPVRPGPIPHHHSSTSSSISSRSYQDYSRPHSRGSTTSTRSAASSVRIGAMYPANSQGMPGYRQRGMKSQTLNSMTSLNSGEKRSTRGHSPVSGIHT